MRARESEGVHSRQPRTPSAPWLNSGLSNAPKARRQGHSSSMCGSASIRYAKVTQSGTKGAILTMKGMN